MHNKYNFMINYCDYSKRVESNEIAVYQYDTGKNYTYNELEERANKLANYLVSEFKITKGDRIAFCCRNSIEFIDAFIATSKIGVILTTYNCLLKEDELVSLIDNEKPKVIFYEGIYINRIERIKAKIDVNKFVVIDGKDVGDEITYEKIMDYYNKTPIQIDNLKEEDIHMLIHTGGTTGTPKAAMISYRSIFHSVLTEKECISLNKDDVVYTFLPLFHTAAWNVFTIPLLFIGGKIILTKEFYPNKTLEIIQKMKPTVLLGVSTIFRMLINDLKFNETDFSSIRLMLSGAAPTPKNIIEKFLDRNIKIGVAYGMTETGANNMYLPIQEMTTYEIREKWNSVGKVMKYNKVKIIDENGREVKQGEIGELVFKGELIFSGYWNNFEESKKVIKGGWVHTGDIGKVSDDGFYYILGRKKNMLITGGENIFPTEIEEVIYKHPSVHEACVIGLSDEKWGEVAKAVIVLKEGSELEKGELKEFLKSRMSSIKIPKYYEIVDSLPKNNVGKIEISKIKELYGDKLK